MEAVIENMDVQYEVAFSTPLFDLARRNVDVLENLHDSLKEHHILPSGMQATGGAALSDVKVRVAMYDGLVTLDVMVDRMRVEFNQFKNQSAFGICKPCVLDIERAIRKMYPNICTKETRFSCTIDIKISDGATGQQLLKDAVKYGDDINLNEFGVVERFPAANVTMLNKQKRWRAVFHAFSGWSYESLLVASCHMDYADFEVYQNLDSRLYEIQNRADEFEKLVRVLLGGVGVNAIDGLDWAASKAEQPK